MNEKLVEQLKVKDKWLRGLFMLIFTVILGIVETVVFVAVVFQFLHVLVTGSMNSHIVPFSKQLILYIVQLYEFLTYQTEEKPFPFGSFPELPKTEATDDKKEG